jgi:prevent-host-death family protein
MIEDAHWQVQEAKQRFSEVLRAVESDGPQTITRHGEEVAVVIDIAEYRRLTRPKADLNALLLGPPYLDDEVLSVMDEIEIERKQDFPREVDFGSDE